MDWVSPCSPAKQTLGMTLRLLLLTRSQAELPMAGCSAGGTEVPRSPVHTLIPWPHPASPFPLAFLWLHLEGLPLILQSWLPISLQQRELKLRNAPWVGWVAPKCDAQESWGAGGAVQGLSAQSSCIHWEGCCTHWEGCCTGMTATIQNPTFLLETSS